MKKSFLSISLLATALCGLVSLTSCCDTSDASDEQKATAETTLPTTDQLEVTSDKTLFLVNGLSSPKQGDNDCVVENVINRFSSKKMVTNEASLAGMNDGDYMLLCVDKNDIANMSSDLKAAIKAFTQKGGILAFAETTSECIDNFLNNDLSLGWTVQPDDDSNEDILHVYYQSVNAPTLHYSHFEDIDANEFANVNHYHRGRIADEMLKQTSEWYKKIESSNGTRSGDTRSDGMSRITDFAKSLSYTHFDSRGFNMEGYIVHQSKDHFDQFKFTFDVYAVKSGNDRYFYVEILPILDFSSAAVPEYQAKIGLRECLVNEWWGHWFDWNMTVDGVNANNVDILTYAPVTEEKTHTFTSGLSWNIGGSGTIGYSGGSASWEGSFNAGLSISNSHSWSEGDVTYTARALTFGRNSLGGRFKFAECEAKASTGYGLVSIRKGASCAHSAFKPEMNFIAKVDGRDPNIDNVKLTFGYWIELISYAGWNEVMKGKMIKDTRYCESHVTIDLSGIKYDTISQE